ncbi:MAG: hypothetical protein IJF95_07965 [Erysipelotrichaceae bacterium]|nr:hypothetical protein [Erysipelotrichaceae bacterium]
MNTVPEMTINLNGISFNRKVLDLLGNPAYVRPLLDLENKAFAVQVCKEKDEKAMKFSRPETSSRGGFTCTGNTIRNTLRRLMKDSWKDDTRYLMTGVLFSEAKAVVFDLSEAKELPPFRETDKE